jgi:hypothetical protein
MSLQSPLESLSDDEVLGRVVALLQQSRRTEAPLLAHLGEVQARRLYARFACSSMFGYCTDVLHMSEAEAYARIGAARAVREHPVLLEMVADGRLHISGIARLAPLLTAENRETLLARAAGKSKRQIEELVAEIHPRPDVPCVIRKLPERLGVMGHSDLDSNAVETPQSVVTPPPDPTEAPRVELVPDRAPEAAPPRPIPPRPIPPPPPAFQPLSLARYKVQFTASAELRDKLERLRALLRSEVPGADLAAVVERAVDVALERIEARRFGRTHAPRKRRTRTDTSSRYVSAEVRRFVFRRDGGQCRFVDADRTRCPERHRLEFHHRHPYGLGGGAEAENICLMCGPHNRYLAELDYGKEFMDRHVRSRKAKGAGSAA